MQQGGFPLDTPGERQSAPTDRGSHNEACSPGASGLGHHGVPCAERAAFAGVLGQGFDSVLWDPGRPGLTQELTRRKMATGALSGLKAVELGSMVSAPFCAKLLASLGVEVVKIEKPGSGDDARQMACDFAEGVS